jgi:hypothetical protein
MRFAVLAVLVACSGERSAPVKIHDAAPREATLSVSYLDTIDGAPATHLAVGGRMRVRVADGPATSHTVVGPYRVTPANDDTFVITALDAGVGQIEIETITGLARFDVSSAQIANVELRDVSRGTASIALLDADGKRLVDTNLRVAGGSAPVTFDDGAWDRIDLRSLAHGRTHDIFVKTDTIAPARVRYARR